MRSVYYSIKAYFYSYIEDMPTPSTRYLAMKNANALRLPSINFNSFGKTRLSSQKSPVKMLHTNSQRNQNLIKTESKFCSN
jgi:hypothetical protein